MMQVNQGKYFLIEEAQAVESADELGVELGFALHNVDLPSAHQKSAPMLGTRMLRSLFRPTTTTASASRATATAAANDTAQPDSSNARSAKSVVPMCILVVYCKDEVGVGSEASASTNAPPASPRRAPPSAFSSSVSSAAALPWQLVYQSDPKRIPAASSDALPSAASITLNALLLLPLPSITRTRGQVQRDRPIRFEVWAGLRKTDTLIGQYEGLLGALLAQVGSPKRFPHSPSMSSHWEELSLGGEGGGGCRLAFRVGFPDRLISVAVPQTVHEVDVSEWRPAPFFAGPTLRGLTFNPVSKAFQASVAPQTTNNGGEENAGLMTDSSSRGLLTKKMTKRKLHHADGSTNLMEFREEMAEMPLNLLIPAAYLELATQELHARCDAYGQKFQRDLGLIRKLATSALGLRGEDFATPKYMDAVQRLDKFALDLTAQGRERQAEMLEAARFYRGEWRVVVSSSSSSSGGTGGGSAVLAASSTTKLRDLRKKRTTASGLFNVDAAVTAAIAAPVDQQPQQPQQPTSDLLAKSSSVDRFAEEVDEDAEREEDEDDAAELELRKAFVEELKQHHAAEQQQHHSFRGVSPMAATAAEPLKEEEEGEEEADAAPAPALRIGDIAQLQQQQTLTAMTSSSSSSASPAVVSSSHCSFRKSTSRKDRRLRFMPINMHLQVLTVRETLVHPKPKPKPAAAAPHVTPGNLGIRDRLKSFTARRMTIDAKSFGGGSSSPPGLLGRPSRASTAASTVRKGFLSSSNNNHIDEEVGGDEDDDDEEEEDVALREETFFYDTLSAGAPAAHALSSKYGGCWQQLKEVTRLREDFKRQRDDAKFDIFTRYEAYRKFKEMEWILGERVDVCLPQALAIMAGAVLSRIYVMAAEFSSSVVGGFGAPDDEVAHSLITHGFLIGWESLLSTHGKEMAMLGDLFYAVQYLSEHVVVRLEVGSADDDDDNDEQQPSSKRNDDNDKDDDEEEEGGEGDDDDEDEDPASAGRLLLKESLDVRLFKTTTHKDNKAVGGGDGGLSVEEDRFLGPGGSDDGAVWLLVARVPSAVVEKLPKVVRTYIESHSASLFAPPSPDAPAAAQSDGRVDLDQLSPAPLKWTCVLFTQGINEMQNVANLMGNNRALQEEINEFSCTKLVEYCVKRFAESPEATKKTRKSVKVLHESGGGGGTSTSSSSVTKEMLLKEEERRRRAKVAYQQSLMWAAKLRISVSNQGQAGKSFEILQNSADLVRWLSGVRIASCKSAKDRTAMSLTWEEARILHNIHFVRDMPLLDLANLFREHGTRLVNVHKNTGVPRYAFNKAQRSFLPESYRPPMSTIGSLFGTNLT